MRKDFVDLRYINGSPPIEVGCETRCEMAYAWLGNRRLFWDYRSTYTYSHSRHNHTPEIGTIACSCPSKNLLRSSSLSFLHSLT
jgi:hypothetical protein